MLATPNADMSAVLSVTHQISTNWVTADPNNERCWPMKTSQKRAFQELRSRGGALHDSRLHV